MKLYLVGLEYDDFSDGGFDVRAVCDSLEKAIAFSKKKFAKTSYDLSIKECDLNTFYKNGIPYEED